MLGGGGRKGTGDLDWPKACPIPCRIMLRNKRWVIKEGRRRHLERQSLSSQEPVTCEGPVFTRVAEHLPNDGKK